MPPRTIAIDGPAGSGKSVVGQWLASRLGYTYLDTGVLYRALTWIALDRGLSTDDGPALAAAAKRAAIEVAPPTADDSRGCRVHVDGRDVTEELFGPAVNAHVSRVAALPEVRRALMPLQRRIADGGGVVRVGRDIGTVVLPDAELKLYLEAPLDERARRRWEQERGLGGDRSLDEVLADLRQRDATDTARETAPLRAADDAIVLQTDRFSLAEEQDHILHLAQRAPAG